MLSDNAAIFLKKHPPFSLLDNNTLFRLVDRLRMEIYPAGTVIIRQGDPQPRSLYIIREGSVSVTARTGEDEEREIDQRDEGETFGFLTPDEIAPMNVSVKAVRDTVCYVADSSAVTDLLRDNPSFTEYLVPPFFPKYGDAPLLPGRSVQELQPGSDRALFTTPVRDIACRDIVTALPDMSVLEAARLMSAHQIGALIIVDGSGRPAGIITTSDLRDRVLADQRDISSPVSEIMSSPPVTMEGSNFCFEALITMMGRNIHHLPVMDEGRLAGMISNHDLLVLQGVSPLLIIREIEGHATIEGIAAASGKIEGLISTLLREGASASGILRIITTVNDRLERKILDLAIQTLGPAPCSFCWIVYGSAGRKEQTFRTDQDNAIIYSDPADETESARASDYFARFADFVVAAFLRCGFKLCQGDFMATNPVWRQPLSIWKNYFSSWTETPTSKAIHNSANLFDFRGLHGDMTLAADLKRHLMNSLRDRQIYLKALAELTTSYRPPLGLLGSLSFEKDGIHAGHLNLKDSCITPLINIVRLFSFESNIPETPTIERIAVLKKIHPVMKKIGDDLEHAFETISLLRIKHQMEQAADGMDPDNFIDPLSLSSLKLRNIREICRLLSQVIDDIALKYQTGTRL